MFDETSEKEIRFSLYDLTLIVSDQYEDLSDDGRDTLRALVLQDPRFTDQLAELRSMACDVETNCVLFAFDVYEKWQALMSDDSWEHVLTLLRDDKHIWFEKVLSLAAKLAERAEDPNRILAVRKKLQAAEAVCQLGTEAFRNLAEHLETLEPGVAELVLERLGHHVRHRENQASGEKEDPNDDTGS